MTKKLVFVDHSFHMKTGSSDFFKEILAEEYDVIELWDEKWRGGNEVTAEQINAHDPDCVIFWQQISGRRQLARIRCTNLVWVPMRDAERLKAQNWRRYRGFRLKIVSFCRELSAFVRAVGLSDCYVQYYPAIRTLQSSRAASVSDGPVVFFWQRWSNFGWQNVRDRLGKTKPSRTYLLAMPDPGHEVDAIPDSDYASFNIERIDRWLSKDEYRELMDLTDLYFVPRPIEGIGMGFLEAMAAGCCVVSPDRYTMNEYIESGVNGILYAPHEAGPVDTSNYVEIANRARDSVVAGRQRWLSDRQRILDFVSMPPRKRRTLSVTVRGMLNV